MAKRGRRPKFDHKIATELTQLIAAGNTHVTACDYVGIHKTTFYQWRKIGLGHFRSGHKSDYSAFYSTLKRAESSFIARNVQVVREAAYGVTAKIKGPNGELTDQIDPITNKPIYVEKPSPGEARWLLQCKDPEHWASKDRKILADLQDEVSALRKIITEMVNAQQQVPAPRGKKVA